MTQPFFICKTINHLSFCFDDGQAPFMAQPLQPQPQPDLPLFLFFMMPRTISATIPPSSDKITAEEIISFIPIPRLKVIF